MGPLAKIFMEVALPAIGVVIADQIKQRGPQLIDAFIKAATPKLKELVAKIEEKLFHKPKPQQ